MKTRDHKFIITMKGAGSKSLAKTRVLAMFAARQPDCWEFSIREYKKPAPAKVVVVHGGKQ